MAIIGIDPGKSGAIALLRDRHTPETFKLTGTEADIAEFLEHCKSERCFAYIEKVNAMPKQGVSSTFKFGMSYGFLRGLLIAMKIPFEEVLPRRWQQYLGCLSKGDKNVTKAKAQQLFPEIKIIHAIADALLIAEYGRRIRGRQGMAERS